MLYKHWHQMGERWKPSMINDTPPDGMKEISDMLGKLCDKAGYHKIDIMIKTPLGSYTLREINCVFETKKKDL